MRNLMVYGNDVNKLVGTGREGITDVQNLPVGQITILDDRNRTATADANDPVIRAERYFLREGETTMQEFPSDEILHVRMDYRSNWFTDNENRITYGLWGASRFTALKQAIRAKYNSMNNRIALEDAMTKQFITIDMEAVKHIQNPDEQRERLLFIMNQVISTMESLRGDQVPIFPDYVKYNTLTKEQHYLIVEHSLTMLMLILPQYYKCQEQPQVKRREAPLRHHTLQICGQAMQFVAFKVF